MTNIKNLTMVIDTVGAVSLDDFVKSLKKLGWDFGRDISVSDVDLTDEICISDEIKGISILNKRLRFNKQFSFNVHNDSGTISVNFTPNKGDWKVMVLHFADFPESGSRVCIDWFINIFSTTIGAVIREINICVELRTSSQHNRLSKI